MWVLRVRDRGASAPGRPPSAPAGALGGRPGAEAPRSRTRSTHIALNPLTINTVAERSEGSRRWRAPSAEILRCAQDDKPPTNFRRAVLARPRAGWLAKT